MGGAQHDLEILYHNCGTRTCQERKKSKTLTLLNMMNTRRSFILKSTVSLAGAALASTSFAKAGTVIKAKSKKEDRYKLGVAGYSFLNFNLEESLAMMKRMDIHYLC